jgi:hypothetical protein
MWHVYLDCDEWVAIKVRSVEDMEVLEGSRRQVFDVIVVQPERVQRHECAQNLMLGFVEVDYVVAGKIQCPEHIE